MLSGDGVILVTEITYFPDKKFKKLLRNHQQLSSLTHYDEAWNMSNKEELSFRYSLKKCHVKQEHEFL